MRELKRNQAPPGKYWPDTAQRKARERRQRLRCLDQDERLQEFVRIQLTCHYWTPEQIAGWLKHRQSALRPVSHETIYAWLYQGRQKREKLWKFLPRHKRKRGLRKVRKTCGSRIPRRIPIQKRPKAVEKRKQFGHFEGDLMAFQRNTQHLLVVQERKSRFILSQPLLSKRAVDTAQTIINLLEALPVKARRTITFDNGGEFAAHQDITKRCGTKAFFCDPYASWQKGSIEHTNGRLRRDLPRKTDLKAMTKENFDETIDNYNDTPRKCLNWLTPHEVFLKNLAISRLKCEFL